MIDYARLGADFWELAMAMAVHIHNRIFRLGVIDIPLRLLNGITLHISYLHTFGYHAYVHLPRANRPKTTPYAYEGIFVGYSPNSPAWPVSMPYTETILTSRLVTLNEFDRLELLDEWHASNHEGCGVSSSSLPITSIPTSVTI
jgi:hypothetical protein